MKLKNLLITWFAGSLACTVQAGTAPSDTLALSFAAKPQAEQLLLADDEFSTHLNQFDYDLRVRRPDSSPEAWRQLVVRESMDWTPAEKQRIIQAFRTLRSHVRQLQLRLPYPDEVVMVKTTMREELDAGGYTRKNWIALADDVLKRASDEQLATLVAHELFHVLSRHSRDFKQAVYGTIGFRLLDREIRYSDDLLARRISNPDISHRDSYTTFIIGSEEVPCAEMIYTTKPYTGGGIMDYLTVGFVPLDADFQPVVKSGRTVIYPLQLLKHQFKAKVGTNTGYIIDPEEISADHFSFLLTLRKDLPNPEILEKIRKVLQ